MNNNHRPTMTPPVIIKWLTKWRNDIERVECARETDSSVWLLTDLLYRDGRRLKTPQRQARACANHKYHDSWEQARDHLLVVAERRLVAARRELEKAQGAYGNIKGMKPPAPETDA
jgi:hypothetical protein